MSASALIGCIVGTAVGDALGLPYEGISRRRARHLLGPPERYRFVFGHGMVSDDTEHTCMIAQALMAAPQDSEAFAADFARRLRWWLLGLPAGIGRATLRAILKSWVGFGPQRSGVFSAGNGPAMRSAILGVALTDLTQLCSFNRVATRITHTDPKAEQGALAIALAARLATAGWTRNGQDYLSQLRPLLADQGHELLTLLERAVVSVERSEDTSAFADAMGLHHGVTGYVLHTVPVVIHAWLRYPRDYRAAVQTVISCGGDTDTTAAIVGGIVGAAVGKEGIPAEWMQGLWEWPRTVAWMERLGQQVYEVLAKGQPARPPRLSVLGLLLRNLFFLVVVLGHVFRRCLPPY